MLVTLLHCRGFVPQRAHQEGAFERAALPSRWDVLYAPGTVSCVTARARLQSASGCLLVRGVSETSGGSLHPDHQIPSRASSTDGPRCLAELGRSIPPTGGGPERLISRASFAGGQRGLVTLRGRHRYDPQCTSTTERLGRDGGLPLFQGHAFHSRDQHGCARQQLSRGGAEPQRAHRGWLPPTPRFS